MSSKKTGFKTLLRSMLICLLLLPLLLTVSAEAQQTKKVPRIGFLTTSPSDFPDRNEAFRQGLRELGYIEGKNIFIEWRYTEGERDRHPALTAALVRLKVDIIVAGSPTATVFLKEATSTIPIVMGYHTDPVGTGLVASLARPGGNITGLSVLAPEIGWKTTGAVEGDRS